MSDRKAKHFIKSVDRGLRVLGAFCDQEPRLTLTRLAKATGMNPAAVQRYTDTLLQLGFLRRNPRREFYLGPGVLDLAAAYLGGNRLSRLCATFVDDFSLRFERTVNVGVLDRGRVVIIFRREAQRFLHYDLGPGSSLPLHCTAMGKVLLAGQPDAELKNLLHALELEKVTSHSIVDPACLYADLIATRERGYAICDRELSLALITLGVPVLDQRGLVMAGLNASLNADPPPDLEKEVTALKKLGATMSQALGYKGPYPSFTSPAPL